MNTKSEGFYLSLFFDYLNRDDVRYCVMNNYHGLPDIIPSDVDIAITPDAFAKLDDIVRGFSDASGLPVVQKIWHGNNKCAYILSPLSVTSWFRLQLDFFVDFSAKGYYRLIPSQLMIADARRMKNFFIPPPEIELPFLVMRRIVKGDVNAEKLKEIRELSERSDGTLNKVADAFPRAIQSLVSEFVGAKAWESLRANINQQRCILRAYSKQYTPIAYRLRHAANNALRIAHRVRHPVGISLCVLGSDGSGKSSLIESLPRVVGGAFHGYQRFYSRPALLPGWTLEQHRVATPSEGSTVSPHVSPSYGTARSLVKLTYYFVEYLLGGIIAVVPAKLRKSLVVFDHYFYDFWIDPARHRCRAPRWLVALYCRLLPIPDVVVVLLATPQVIVNRKREVSAEELSRQYEALSGLVTICPRAAYIDANQNAEEVGMAVAEVVLSFCERKTRRAMECGS